MAKIYFKRIKAGIMVLEEVPAKWRDAVLILMREDVENNVITADDFERLTGVNY